AHAAASAARGGARLFVGHSERFNPVVRALARLVREDGAVSIDLRRVGPSRPCGCGALINLGIHDIDLAAYLGGGDVVLRGAVGGSLTRDSTEDFARVVFTTGGGAVGQLTVDRTLPAKERVIDLATRRWLYHGDLLAHRLTRMFRGESLHSDVPLLLDEPLMAQAVALADALDGAPVHDLATGADGIAAVEIAEQAAAQCAAPPSGPRGSENLSVDARR
ncbi:MAG: Gfo/Idh/MocA family protein, partial [Polyangiaceae bacterium]